MIQTAMVDEKVYADFDNMEECIEHICKLFETHLQKMYPEQDSITYDVSQLFEFIDELPDIYCMVYDSPTKKYTPNDKAWLKQVIFKQLKTESKKAMS